MKFLVPVDFSEVTSTVVEKAISCAEAFGGEIALLHVIQPAEEMLVFDDALPLVSSVHATLPFSYGETVRVERQKELDALVESISSRSVKVMGILEDGNPAERILSAVESVEADWIIIGSHGHGILYHLVLGSVSEKVVDKAHLPVLVVKSEKKEEK